MSDLFEEILEEAEEGQELPEEQPPREWGVDFTTGQLTGYIVEGAEAIKVWAWNVLQTPRYRYMIYSWFYGHDFEELIGSHFSEEYIESELKKMLTDCLLVNPYIEKVKGIEYAFNEETLTVHCILVTAFGEEELDV